MATAVGSRCSTRYAVIGAGPPVLLLPGWFVPGSGWGPLIPHLAAGHRVIAVDHGATSVGAGERRALGITGMAAAAVGVLDDAGVGAAHVVGNSLGGVVAQALATRHPERVLSLVLLATSPGTPSIPPNPLLLLNGLRALRRQPHVRAAQARGRPRGSSGRAAQLLVPLGWCGLRELRRVQARTLVLHGSRDRVVPLTNARLLASLVPCAQLIVVEGAGHLILSDAPEQVAEAISEFLVGLNVLAHGALGMMVLAQVS